jgi:phosphate transport system protein
MEQIGWLDHLCMNKNAVSKLYEMDDTVDTLYRKYLQRVVIPKNRGNRGKVEAEEMNPICYGSALLILRYLERISDHACYVSDYINYIVTGADQDAEWQNFAE